MYFISSIIIFISHHRVYRIIRCIIATHTTHTPTLKDTIPD